jgi:hypothetical protein
LSRSYPRGVDLATCNDRTAARNLIRIVALALTAYGGDSFDDAALGSGFACMTGITEDDVALAVPIGSARPARATAVTSRAVRGRGTR